MAELLLKDEKVKSLLRQYCETGSTPQPIWSVWSNLKNQGWKLEEIMSELQPLLQRYFPHRKLYNKYRTMIVEIMYEGLPPDMLEVWNTTSHMKGQLCKSPELANKRKQIQAKVGRLYVNLRDFIYGYFFFLKFHSLCL
jgi:hypothetical protein